MISRSNYGEGTRGELVGPDPPPLDLSRRIPELDGLRGIAIGMVLVSHYVYQLISAPVGSLSFHILALGRLAWSGVDLFFVLSGFLIGGILLDAKDASNYFGVFYKRRFFRIVPIYSVLLLVWLALRFAIRSGMLSRLAWIPFGQIPGISYLLFFQNISIAFLNTGGVIPLAVTWSLAVEEQFYLTLPLIIRLLRPKHLLIFIFSGIILAPTLRFALHLKWPGNPWAWYVLTPCRADALLLGVLGAIMMRHAHCRNWLRQRKKAFGLALVVLFLGLGPLTKWAAGFSNTTGTWVVTFGYTWLAVFYLCVLLYALMWRDSVLSGCLRLGSLRWLGSIAYGVYLFHLTFLYLVYGLIWSRPPKMLSASNVYVTVLALVATLVFCWASWMFFEKPLVKLGHREHYQFEDTSISLQVPAAVTES